MKAKMIILTLMLLCMSVSYAQEDHYAPDGNYRMVWDLTFQTNDFWELRTDSLHFEVYIKNLDTGEKVLYTEWSYPPPNGQPFYLQIPVDNYVYDWGALTVGTWEGYVFASDTTWAGMELFTHIPPPPACGNLRCVE